MDSINLTISIIFLILTASLIIILILYFIFWKPSSTSTVPCVNNNCDLGQVCQAGFCNEIICSSDTQCQGNGLCINSYCTSFKCLNGNDCPTGMACVNGQCNRTGSPCTSNTNCLNLTCMNNLCVQCLSNSNCPVGQGCFSQACRFPYASETSNGQINYISPAQNNGIIEAPPGYFCTTTTCGTGPNSQNPISCGLTGITGLTGLCPSNCPFCVNSLCRCTAGQITEQCVINSDCLSNVCNNNICVPTGNQCLFNHTGTGCTGCCSVTLPYCVAGICSATSLGAPCGSTDVPFDLCNNPQALGATGMTGVTSNGMGFFCVNGH